MRLSLAAKGLILVAIPLCFELAFVVVLVDLQRQAEAESAIAMRSKKVAQGIAAQTHDLFALWQTIYNTTRTQWRSTGRFDQSYKPGVAKLLAGYNELVELTPDDPEINKRVRISRSTLLNAEVILDSIAYRYLSLHFLLSVENSFFLLFVLILLLKVLFCRLLLFGS